MAGLIADEARLSTHKFEHEEQIFEKLIRHNKVNQILYRHEGHDEETMPAGMEAHDVYLLQWELVTLCFIVFIRIYNQYIIYRVYLHRILQFAYSILY